MTAAELAAINRKAKRIVYSKAIHEARADIRVTPPHMTEWLAMRYRQIRDFRAILSKARDEEKTA